MYECNRPKIIYRRKELNDFIPPTEPDLFKKICKEIAEDFDNTLAKEFVFDAGTILVNNGIRLSLAKHTIESETIDEPDKVTYKEKYNVVFGGIDTSEHDIDILRDAIHQLDNSKVNCHEDYVDGICFSIGVLEGILDKIREKKDGSDNRV